MSKRQTPWWIHLYPATFRERYEDEMLLLLRDRMRDATGLWDRFQIRLALVYDLVLTLPRMHLHRFPATSSHVVEGEILTFRVLDEKGPGYLIYAISMIASLAGLHLIQSQCPCATHAKSGNVSGLAQFNGMIHALLGYVIK